MGRCRGGVLVHVVIATTIGVALFHVLPHRAVEGIVAGLFVLGAVYAWREGAKEEAALIEHEVSAHSAVVTAFVVSFVAEWGDLTQILTANLAARYHSPLSVGVGATLALWTVAAIAVASGQGLLRWLKIATIRKVTAIVLIVLAGVHDMVGVAMSRIVGAPSRASSMSDATGPLQDRGC